MSEAIFTSCAQWLRIWFEGNDPRLRLVMGDPPPKELNYLYTALQTAVFFSIRLYAFCLYLINGSRDQGHEHSGPLSQMKGLNCLNPKCQSVCGAVFYHGVQAVSWGSPSSRLSWWRNENFFWVLLLAAAPPQVHLDLIILLVLRDMRTARSTKMLIYTGNSY